jgi:hypothetical protein
MRNANIVRLEQILGQMPLLPTRTDPFIRQGGPTLPKVVQALEHGCMSSLRSWSSRQRPTARVLELALRQAGWGFALDVAGGLDQATNPEMLWQLLQPHAGRCCPVPIIWLKAFFGSDSWLWYERRPSADGIRPPRRAKIRLEFVGSATSCKRVGDLVRLMLPAHVKFDESTDLAFNAPQTTSNGNRS